MTDDAKNLSREFYGTPDVTPRWSPDGKIIRVSVLDSKGGGISLSQLNPPGHNLIRMLSDWGPSSRAWAGRWTRPFPLKFASLCDIFSTFHKLTIIIIESARPCVCGRSLPRLGVCLQTLA